MGSTSRSYPGETFSLVGESGCGKTTLGRTVIQLTPSTDGRVVFDGYELADVDPDDMRPLRRRMQIIFQDPFGSLNPRMPVSDLIGEGLLAQGLNDRAARDKRVEDALELVGLRREYSRRYPHEFSGGQRQRIGVARALALGPDFIVADEPVSALDVSIQSQVLNLLLDLKRDLNLTYLFISHNLSVVQYFSDRVGVMYLGKIVEIGIRRAAVPEPAPPVHGRPPVGDPGRGSAPPQEAPGPQGRRAVTGRTAVGLPVPHAMLAARATRQSRELRDRGAAVAHLRGRGSSGRVPLGRGHQPGDGPAGRSRGRRGRHRRRRGRVRGFPGMAAPGRKAPLAGILVLVMLLVGACGAATGSPSSDAMLPSGDASPSQAASSGDAEAPQPTSWPGGVVEAIVILGKADLEIKAAGGDLGAAAAAEDLEAMWGAADGLATLIERLQRQVDRIRDYPVTAAAAAAYDAAFPNMLAGATKIRDAIRAGDAAGLTAGSQQLAQGTAAYEDARREIGPLVEPALLMQRVLVK